MLKMAPLISIITVNFNDKIGLERTLESVFSQNFRNFEYLVIDGGSNDGSKELLEKNSEKINYWVSEPDQRGSAEAEQGHLQRHEQRNFLCKRRISYFSQQR